MELIKPDINLDFVGKRRMAVIFSAALILIGLVSLIAKGGPNYGIDFAGGTLVQVKFVEATTAKDIKVALKDLDLRGLTVQQFGDEPNEYLLRAQESSSKLEGLSQTIGGALDAVYGADQAEIRRVEMVGPQVGKDLRKKGLMAIFYAMIGILIYVTWRFEFRFAVGAILALLHDVVITLGIFSLSGKEIDLPIIAAFLAIIGYSLNDTIIVYDRIRENQGKHAKQGLEFLINRSINETLSRTILTSGTTLMVVLALFIFGGGVIHNFAFALLVGVLIGTFSSIFVASPLLIFWQNYRNRVKAKASA
ncbi:protein-export membrane protein SecF [Syntrophotalea acetylenivorans]|uniref:Protein-export membrane protein SecF n=1 Tax=Syntrophotalea acetylenivorans TaxID=1842532 RepID=A0A1L3GMU2_9BACT|nr:protein translocase subunit SecF [Syntrophotalea acetylenivorans]APG27215.1 protein-export membrane protein SecF [Syntrophotalea acetylenivorans]